MKKFAMGMRVKVVSGPLKGVVGTVGRPARAFEGPFWLKVDADQPVGPRGRDLITQDGEAFLWNRECRPVRMGEV